MADTQEPSPANLLDQLTNLDPQERREVATIVRGLSETLAEVPCRRRWPPLIRASRREALLPAPVVSGRFVIRATHERGVGVPSSRSFAAASREAS